MEREDTGVMYSGKLVNTKGPGTVADPIRLSSTPGTYSQTMGLNAADTLVTDVAPTSGGS